MKSALIILAEDFEELEAVTVMDLLVRAGVEIISAGLKPGPVRASRNTVLTPSHGLDDVKERKFDLLVLPGGLPGADHLAQDTRVITLVQAQVREKRLLGAICAAPRVLVKAGVATDKTITCYPGALAHLDTDATQITEQAVEVDLPLITSRGPGTAMDFALTLIEHLLNRPTRDRIEAQLVR